MNEKLTKDITTGLEGLNALQGAVSGGLAAASILTGPVAAAFAAVFASVVIVKVVEIKLADGGKGVHWPITWLQWATIVAALPGGPVGAGAMMAAVLHPLRNK